MTRREFWQMAYFAAATAAPVQYRLEGLAQYCVEQADAALAACEERWPPRTRKGGGDETTRG